MYTYLSPRLWRNMHMSREVRTLSNHNDNKNTAARLLIQVNIHQPLNTGQDVTEHRPRCYWTQAKMFNFLELAYLNSNNCRWFPLAQSQVNILQIGKSPESKKSLPLKLWGKSNQLEQLEGSWSLNCIILHILWWTIEQHEQLLFLSGQHSSHNGTLNIVWVQHLEGGMVASWLVRSTLDRAVWVQDLAGNIALCSWVRHSTLTVPLSTQVIFEVMWQTILPITKRM